MKLIDHIIYLNETLDIPKMQSRIAYGIRDAKTHEPIKFFSNLHFYKELQEFKMDESNKEKLESKEWKITNELQNGENRFFEFWGSDKIHPITKDETDIRKYKKN